jgi:hypothetical protein
MFARLFVMIGLFENRLKLIWSELLVPFPVYAHSPFAVAAVKTLAYKGWSQPGSSR